MLELTPRKKSIYERFLKRPLDFTMAWIALILLTPIILVISLLVYIKLGSPVFFIQERPGLNEKVFRMYKFRSMTNKKDSDGKLLPDSERLTKFGRFLRATSLDELPEVFNIVRGEMSFVGPRPQLVKDLVSMSKDQRKRHTIRPGLTGLAQVNGRSLISWEEKFHFDSLYIDNISLMNDVRIILKTIQKVLVQEGTSANNEDSFEDLGDYLLRTNKIIENDYYDSLEKSQEIIKSFNIRKMKK